MKRLFIAAKVALDPDYQPFLKDFQFDLRYDDIVWAKDSVRHLTLRFIGATPAAQVDTLKKILSETCRQAAPFTLTIDKIGVFGSHYAPDTLWMGFRNSAPMRELFDRMEKSLTDNGFAPNEGHFLPHITLGRIKKTRDKQRFWKVFEKHPLPFTQTLFIREMTLYQSFLHRDGPEYKPLCTRELGGAAAVAAQSASGLRGLVP